MQSLWDSVEKLTYVCLYLAPAPSHGDKAWMIAAPSLKGMGWGLLPTYVGQQVIGPGSHVVTPAQGTLDAQDAAALASSAGIARGSVIYLDIENGGSLTSPPQPDQVGYVRSWINEVHRNTDYWAGVYCHKTTAPQIANLAAPVVAEMGHRVPTWAFGGPVDTGPRVVNLDTEPAKDPALSGFGDAVAWQYRMSLNGSIDLTWTDRNTGAPKRLNKVDLDTANIVDPQLA
jgi:hypothetical protein